VTTATRVYLARLAGVPVIDPNGDQIGRIRDTVVALRSAQQPPRVLGLVVEIQTRRRIFVPVGRITAIDVEAVVLSTGTINLRRFARRLGESLVLAELLDRRVTVRDGDIPAIVVDVAMEQNRIRDWVVTKIAVREVPAGRIGRRRGHLIQLDWDEVTGLIHPTDTQGAANLLAVFDKLRAADLANVLQDLSSKRRREVAFALDDERLADVLEELPEDKQVEILAAMESERAADVLEAMDPDDAADLLGELPQLDRQRLLELMEPQEAGSVRRLLDYREGTAGAMMTSEPIILPPDATVAEALARLREPQLTPALAAQAYVCRPPMATPTGRYLGIAHIQRLLREPPSELVSGLVDTDLDPVRPEAELSEVTRHLARYNLVALPVVDNADRLVGAVSVDDVLDHLLPTDWRERHA
jgi:Mg/Co/Ni transporter MgtE